MRLLDRYLRKVVRDGPLTVIYAGGETRCYGHPNRAVRPVTIRLTDNATPWRIVLSPSLGAGEAYMDGRLVIEHGDVRNLMDLIGYNTRWDPSNPAIAEQYRPKRLASLLKALNWKRRSRRNVAHHYDLPDRLYDLFLDADRQYSAAYFTDFGNGLEHAQADKKAHIAAKLLLEPGQRVLDIGCGWGGLALYLHRVSGADVLGITLSQNQLEVARERAERAGVASHVKFELVDYRDVKGQFDRIVSVGMFEHVGPLHYGRFMARCRDLLNDDGVMLLHTIGRASGPARMDPWVSKYIFPGGYIPALSQIAPAVERAGLWLTDLEVLRLHYARTLEHWYARTEAAKAQIVALNDERFFRMWEFYLAGAIVAFKHSAHCNFQVQLARRRDAVPLTRDYMMATEARLHSPRPAEAQTPEFEPTE